MNLEPNTGPAEVMHIDLNSAFAMTEQQANPLLRGKPVGVTNRLNDWAICITASYEAKLQGIKIGTRWREARQIDRSFVMVESNPDKYQYVHRKMRAIFQSYSPVSYMKSIDEGIIDFTGMQPVLKGRPLEDIAREIKQRVRDEVGDYMTVNIGIAQNRWLAKVAAGFNKPDGLLTILPTQQEALLSTMRLEDLPYIKKRNRLRLNDAGIYTPSEFYHAPYWVLFRQVFKSVNGHHWYLKLRGYETEVEYEIKTIGRNYVLENRTDNPRIISDLLHKASVKVCRRLRQKGFAARGLALGFRYRQEEPYQASHWSRSGWMGRYMWTTATDRSDQLFERAMALFATSPPDRVVVGFDLTSYGLEQPRTNQPTLFDDDYTRRGRLDEAANAINDRYGELTIAPANIALRPENPMKDKVPFGTVRYFD